MKKDVALKGEMTDSVDMKINTKNTVKMTTVRSLGEVPARTEIEVVELGWCWGSVVKMGNRKKSWMDLTVSYSAQGR